jgi:23S rRNA (pseudouridine1915-N3)-methyltransferase
MKIEVWWIGKTKEKYLNAGIHLYFNRLKHYNKVETLTIPDVKPLNDPNQLKNAESDRVLSKLSHQDFLVLCDERGKQYQSVSFASKLESWLMQSQYKRIVFLIAGAYGASDSLKDRSDALLSLSEFTFSHQMARLILMEQLYRAFTILRNEKYHNV